ncbi:MAG: hypothetical protein ACK4Z6_06230 [Candidatus Methylomirabilales bacterium]
MKERLIVAKAPTRIDFAGGTLDIPPLYLFHPPAFTINVAISLFATVTIRPLREGIALIAQDRGREARWPSAEAISWKGEPFLELVARLIRSFQPQVGIEVATSCQAPAGAGIGGSSALAIAATAALSRLVHRRLTKPALIEYAKGIETQTIRVPTGYQDYYAAVYGGISAIEFTPAGITRSPLGDRTFFAELGQHLLLVYTGRPRFSGKNNWMLFKRHIEGNRAVFRFFEALKANALAMREAFLARKIPAIAQALNRDWEVRRRMLPTMSTPRIDALIRQAKRHGVLGARVCGAGGGGCVAFLMEPDARPRLVELVESHGARVLPCSIPAKGLTVREEEGSWSQRASRSA